MQIGLAIWPASNAEWLELGLSSKLGHQVDNIGAEIKDPISPLDIMIIDGDSPGPHFTGYYKALISGFGNPALIVLGKTESPALRAIQWTPSETVFIPKPYEIEMVLQQVLKKADIKNQNVGGVLNSDSEQKPITLGYLSTLPLADLIQMLCMSEWTGMVCVEHLTDGVKGYVYISDGVLYHAESTAFQGLNACYHMLKWGRCQYSFNEEEVLDKITIRMPWQEIMLEGARMMDESGDDNPSLESEQNKAALDMPDIF